MLTNAFRLGGLQQISWFQLIPEDGDHAPPFEEWEINMRTDFVSNKVLNAHVKLQNEGHLSAWTYDTSRSLKDVGLKLWVFLPGRNENISSTVQSATPGLKVVGSGLWCFPKDHGEVAAVLSQALRNRMERAFRGLGYMRFGDVFVKCRPIASNESQVRKPLPTCEVIFTASEEAIFVHFLVQRKRVRTLSSDDMQTALRAHLDGLADIGERPTVVVAPHGLSGQLTGCCSGDLVHELYESKLKDVSEHLASGLLLHTVSSSFPARSSVYGLHAEVYFGHAGNASVAPQASTVLNTNRSLNSEHNLLKGGTVTSDREDENCSKVDHLIERVLLYPPEAVLIVFVPIVPSGAYLKRCWMQWAGSTWIEDELLAGLTVASSCSSRCGVGKTSSYEKLDGIPGSTNASYGIKSPTSKSSSSSSSSSGGSSIEISSSHGSSSSSDSDGGAGVGPGELEADADSLVMKGNMSVAFKQAPVSSGQPPDDCLDDMKGFEDIIASGKWGRSGGTAQGEIPMLKGTRKSSSSGGEVSNEVSRSMQNRTDGVNSGMGLSPNMGVGTPKAVSSQVGTPWDWQDDDRGLSMGIETDADILAEFGDFGDFFEDDGLGFGEPPGTAESQAMIFPLTDCVEGITSPGTGCLDFSDPMLLPILDIPVLEGLGEQHVFSKDEKISGYMSGFQKDFQVSVKSPAVPLENQNAALDSLPKVEAMVLFAPGYDPVSFPSRQTGFQKPIFKSPYLPEARKAQLDGPGGLELYVYGATPPASPKVEGFGKKREHYEHISERESNGKRVKGAAGKYVKGKVFTSSDGVPGRMAIETSPSLGVKAVNRLDLKAPTWSESRGFLYGQKATDRDCLKRSLTKMLATYLESFMLQFHFIHYRDTHFSKNLSRIALNKCSFGSFKERTFDTMHSEDSSTHAKLTVKQQQERKKKDRIPSRIAGDVDEDIHDGPRASQVGVWRPVGTPKPQRSSHSSWNDNSQSSSVITSAEPGTPLNQENATSNIRLSQRHEFFDAIPFLVQQASVCFDVAFDGDCGDGPFGWLISQEQERRKSVCGPDLSHAGCGGMLCASHFLDNAGVELLDPLTSEISAASVATVLHSDIRVAMATAFEDAQVDGPLSLGEWLRGHALLSDTLGSDSLASDLRESASTVTVAIGEPITPPQCTTGGPLGLKASVQDVENQACDSHRSSSSWAMEGSSLSDDGCTRRCGQETTSMDSDTQPNSSRGGPTVVALPVPSLLVGYQDDWLKISSSTLHFWEKAPLEPYATAKPVSYYVLCPRIDSLLCATADYLQQLSCVYEACRLGTHGPGNMVFGQTGFPASTGKHAFSGFMAIDFPTQATPVLLNSNVASSMDDYVFSIRKTWNVHEFRKALREACKGLPVSANTAVQREPENGPCLVFYVICPSSDPDAVLQTMIDACQSIGHSFAISDKDRRAGISSQTQRTFATSAFLEDSSIVPAQGVIGFSAPKLVLQVLTAETIFKLNKPVSVQVDSLKEVAFTVYNKIRRLPSTSSCTDYSLHASQVVRGRPVSLQPCAAIPGVWKDCGTGRSSGANSSLLGQDSMLESSAFRSNSWDGPWQQHGTTSDTGFSALVDAQMSRETSRYLFEPLFILAEPGALDHGVGFSSSRSAGFDDASGSVHPVLAETMPGSVGDGGSEFDIAGGGTQKVANLHCCYGWTEDWQWLMSVWTDARGEILDVHLFPMVCVNGRWDAKILHNLFVQVLLHGCQLLTMATRAGSIKARSLVITRIGAFYELECQEWQKAVFTVGGSEMRKWPVQIWHQPMDTSGMSGSSSSLQPQDTTALSERTLALASNMPSSPGPSSSVFTSRTKPSNFVKAEIGSSTSRKQTGGGHGQNDVYRGAFHLVQSISFVTVIIEHSLQLMGPNDIGSQSGGSQSLLFPSSWSSSSSANALGTGFGLVKTLASTSASFFFIPAHGLRFLSPPPLQLPIHCTSESPVMEQLQKNGFASSLASAFIVSRATPSVRTGLMQKSIEEWPSTLHVSLIGHMSNAIISSAHQGPSGTLGNDVTFKTKVAKSVHSENHDQATDAHIVLEMVAAELQNLSWLTVSPAFPFRRTALPFHCDVLQRLRRLLHYADSVLPGLQEH